MFGLLLGTMTGIIIGYILWGKQYSETYQQGYEDAKATYNDYNKGFRNGYECAGDIILQTASEWCKNDIISRDTDSKKEKEQDGKEG